MTSALLEHHIRYVFRNGRLDKVLRFYGSVRYRKFTQNGFYARERVLDALVQRITKGRRNVVIAFGSANVGSCVKGNPPIGAKAFRRHCQKRCKVVLIDEYLTSKVCSKCNKRTLKQMQGNIYDDKTEEWHRKAIWAVQVCQDCAVVWNRDVNASRNMLAIFMSLNENGVRPPAFRRPTVASSSSSSSASSPFEATISVDPPPGEDALHAFLGQS